MISNSSLKMSDKQGGARHPRNQSIDVDLSKPIQPKIVVKDLFNKDGSPLPIYAQEANYNDSANAGQARSTELVESHSHSTMEIVKKSARSGFSGHEGNEQSSLVQNFSKDKNNDHNEKLRME